MRRKKKVNLKNITGATEEHPSILVYLLLGSDLEAKQNSGCHCVVLLFFIGGIWEKSLLTCARLETDNTGA
jgi:hypothetical protein